MRPNDHHRGGGTAAPKAPGGQAAAAWPGATGTACPGTPGVRGPLRCAPRARTAPLLPVPATAPLPRSAHPPSHCRWPEGAQPQPSTAGATAQSPSGQQHPGWLNHNGSAKPAGAELKPLWDAALNFVPFTSSGLPSLRSWGLPSGSRTEATSSSGRWLLTAARSWPLGSKGPSVGHPSPPGHGDGFLWHNHKGSRSAMSSAPAGWSEPSAHMSPASPEQSSQGSADLCQPRSLSFELGLLREEHRKTLSSRRVQSFATSKATWAARQEPKGCASAA